MTTRDEFERLLKERDRLANLERQGERYWILDYQLKWEGYQMRQPEIERLRAENQGLADLFQKQVDAANDRKVHDHREIQRLQAEVEKLLNEKLQLAYKLNAAQSNLFSLQQGQYEVPSAAMKETK